MEVEPDSRFRVTVNWKMAAVAVLSLGILIALVVVETGKSAGNQALGLVQERESSASLGVNGTGNATWLAQYESDGSKGATNADIKSLPAGKTWMSVLVLIATGALVIGVQKRRTGSGNERSDG